MPPAQGRLRAERHLYATPRLRGPMGRGRPRRANAGDDPASDDDAIPVRPRFVSPRSWRTRSRTGPQRQRPSRGVATEVGSSSGQGGRRDDRPSWRGGARPTHWYHARV